MNKILIGLLVALSVALAGCGGGGGGGGSTPDGPVVPPINGDSSSRTLSGRIVSSASGSGVANVVVSLGGFTGITDTGGNFQIGPVPAGTEIPHVFTVDTAGAGAGYHRDDLVTYRNQQYLYNEIDTPVEIRNADTNNFGTITVRYAPDDVPSIPFPSKDTLIVGRVVRSDTSMVGIAGVTIRFGNVTTVTTTSGRGGYFALNLGRDADVIPLFSGSLTFSIDTSTAGSTYPSSLEVVFLGQSYAQNSLPVPQDVLRGDTTNLGTITVQVGGGGGIGGGGGGDVPPPPPL